MRCFLSLLEASGRVGASCAALGLSRRSVTKLRRRNPVFAAAWEAAVQRREARVAALCDISTIPDREPDHAALSNAELRVALSRMDSVLARRKPAPVDPMTVNRPGTLGRTDRLRCQPNGNSHAHEMRRV